MEIGPHVFGDNRLGLWAIDSSWLNGKLKHVLPRVRAVMPVTDIFLPESATLGDKSVVRENDFFAALWTAPHGRPALAYADYSVAALNRLQLGALELNIEEPDAKIKDYVTAAVGRIRKFKPKLRLRVNIAPFKARFLPTALFQNDPNLYVIEQAYFGNMDGRAAEDDCLMDLLYHGIPIDKASVMYGVLNVAQNSGGQRVLSLPSNRRRWRRGSVFSDDLLMTSGLLPQ